MSDNKEQKKKAAAPKAAPKSAKFMFKQAVHLEGKDFHRGLHDVSGKIQQNIHFKKYLSKGLIADPSEAKMIEKASVEPTEAQQKILDSAKPKTEATAEESEDEVVEDEEADEEVEGEEVSEDEASEEATDDEDFTSDEEVEASDEEVSDEEETEEAAPKKKAKKKKSKKKR